MQALGAVMDNVDNYEEALSPLLLELGHNHYTHFQQLNADYFNAFEEAILFVFKEDLGIKFSPEVKEAWEKVLTFIMQELQKGYMLASGEDGSQEF